MAEVDHETGKLKPCRYDYGFLRGSIQFVPLRAHAHLILHRTPRTLSFREISFVFVLRS